MCSALAGRCGGSPFLRDFLALHLPQASSAIWREAALKKVLHHSRAQVIISYVTLGEKIHHSGSHFAHLQNQSNAMGLPSCSRTQWRSPISQKLGQRLCISLLPCKRGDEYGIGTGSAHVEECGKLGLLVSKKLLSQLLGPANGKWCHLMRVGRRAF